MVPAGSFSNARWAADFRSSTAMMSRDGAPRANEICLSMVRRLTRGSSRTRDTPLGSWTVPDFDEVGAMIGSGSVAAVLVYEELVIFPLIAAWRRGGARVVAEGQISPEDIVLALDATKSN